MNAGARNNIVGASIFGALILGVLLYLAWNSIELPDVQVAEDLAKLVVSILAGLIITIGAAAVIVAGIKTLNPWITLLGLVFFLIGMPLLGVYVGLPEPLKPIFGALQAIVDLANLLIRLLGKVI